MLEVTRGRVDNENISKLIFKHIEYSTRGGLYIRSESIAIRNRNITEFGSEHRKAMCTGGKHRNAMRNTGQEQELE